MVAAAQGEFDMKIVHNFWKTPREVTRPTPCCDALRWFLRSVGRLTSVGAFCHCYREIDELLVGMACHRQTACGISFDPAVRSVRPAGSTRRARRSRLTGTAAQLGLSFNWLVSTTFLLLAGVSFAQEPRPGIVQFSNGETVAGQISLTPGAELKIVNGTTLSTLTLDKVQEIRLAPEEETLEQKWRFPVAGQTRKEKWGAPYPVRHLRATVVLGNGQTVAGHLYTTVLYLEGPEKNQKIILEAKQRGQEGATFQSLVYPASVRFTDVAVAAESRIRLQTGLPGTIVALTRGALVRLQASGDQLPSPLGAELFVAVQTATNIMVGWPRSERGEPAENDEVITKAVRDALPDVRDFFDVLGLHGVWRDPITGDVYSLMLLERRGATTLNAERSQPWRCEVWRWKFADEDKKLLVAGRNYFFRGIVTRGEPAPAVTTSLRLWNLHKSGETWKTGDQ